MVVKELNKEKYSRIALRLKLRPRQSNIPMIQTPCHMRWAYRPPFREEYWPTNQRGNRPWIHPDEW